MENLTLEIQKVYSELLLIKELFDSQIKESGSVSAFGFQTEDDFPIFRSDYFIDTAKNCKNWRKGNGKIPDELEALYSLAIKLNHLYNDAISILATNPIISWHLLNNDYSLSPPVPFSSTKPIEQVTDPNGEDFLIISTITYWAFTNNQMANFCFDIYTFLREQFFDEQEETENVIQQNTLALIYYYLHVSKSIPFFENYSGYKTGAINNLSKRFGVSPKKFQLVYNRFCRKESERIKKTMVPHLNSAIQKLTEYPKAQQLAMKELALAKSKIKN